jgi:hypothetical protein
MADHQRDTSGARRIDDLIAFFDRRGNRLFHKDVDAPRDAGKRDVAVQMSRRCNGDRIDAHIEQLLNGSDRGAAQSARDEFSLFPIGIGDADEFDTGKTSENAGMIAPHHADTNNADAHNALRSLV